VKPQHEAVRLSQGGTNEDGHAWVLAQVGASVTCSNIQLLVEPKDVDLSHLSLSADYRYCIQHQSQALKSYSHCLPGVLCCSPGHIWPLWCPACSQECVPQQFTYEGRRGYVRVWAVITSVTPLRWEGYIETEYWKLFQCFCSPRSSVTYVSPPYLSLPWLQGVHVPGGCPHLWGGRGGPTNR
jgi:hypothetical protein